MRKLKQIVKLFIGYLYFIQLNKKLNRILNEVEVVFFFPFYHTGGAEKVHAEIVEAVCSKKCVVFFTKASATSNMLPLFANFANCLELNAILKVKNYTLTRFLTKSIVNKINTSKSIKKFFGANSDYFYEILPKIDTRVKRLDLFHAFSPDDYRESLVVESAKYIDTRIVINQVAKSSIESYYKKSGLTKFISNIQIISNGVELPPADLIIPKDILKIGFVARWSEEKRPEFFLKAASILKKKFPEVIFYMAGSGTKPRKDLILSNGVELYGDIKDIDKLKSVYLSTSILVLTSIYEGFPMVFMEGMSYGCIPVTTNVGGINAHIHHGINGFLIDEIEEDTIVSSLVMHLSNLIEHPLLLNELSENCREYAFNHFSINQFKKAYKLILN